MKKNILTALLCMGCISAMAQVPAGVPQMGAFGFGGNQASDTQAEWGKKYTDINYVGDGEEYHNLVETSG